MPSLARHNRLPGKSCWTVEGRNKGEKEAQGWKEDDTEKDEAPSSEHNKLQAHACLTPLLSLTLYDCGNSEINKKDLSCKITECFEQCLVIEGQ